MCGIVGYFGGDINKNRNNLHVMTASLSHRGPDERGTWISENSFVGLGHTRLAIIDFASGKQPMCSNDGRLVITFNGEIYNYKQLRQELLDIGAVFRTNSDTEVILESYAAWGKSCISKLNGMFAFAIYDQRQNELILARDRIGIKPLYYFDGPNGFIFGSELKAVLANSGTARNVDYQSLVSYLVFSYPLLPRTFFRDIYELTPGTILTVKRETRENIRYWQWKRKEDVFSLKEAVDMTRAALIESAETHLVSDVPVAAFLSGGIDSSLLVALISRELGRKIDTFTVGFSDPAFDESAAAKKVARMLCTNHHEVFVEPKLADLMLVENIMDSFDQPFGDSSAIPTYIICREIRKQFKVAISGDGGDEMFFGYPRFRYADLVKHLGQFGILLRFIKRYILSFEKLPASFHRKAQRLLYAALANDITRMTYLSCYVYPEEFSNILTATARQKTGKYYPALGNSEFNDLSAKGFADLTIATVLPGDYLRKIDIASSSHGLEVRVPYLGNPVIECASHTSVGLNYDLCNMKKILCKLATKYLPSDIVRRKKSGFVIPLDTWLSNAMKMELVAQLRSPHAPINELIEADYVNEISSSFLKGNWKNRKYSRFVGYQRLFMIWSLNRWLTKWQPNV